MQEVPTPNKWSIKCVRARVNSVSLSKCVTFYYYYKVSTYNTQSEQSVVQPLLSLFFYDYLLLYVRCAFKWRTYDTRLCIIDIDRFIV